MDLRGLAYVSDHCWLRLWRCQWTELMSFLSSMAAGVLSIAIVILIIGVVVVCCTKLPADSPPRG